MRVERTQVTARARQLSASWTAEKPLTVEWIEPPSIDWMTFKMTVVNPEYRWLPHKKSSLTLDRAGYHPVDEMGQYLDRVQAWCQETGNGRRTSYDTFHFSRPAKMTAFILKWGS